MKAVVLAGGKGVRLRPYTTCIPKPLVPIGDEMTMIEVLLRQLARQGFDEVFIALGHMGGLIRGFVGDGSRWGLSITCWDEITPLGTAGPLVHHIDELPGDFLVMNADILCNLDMGAMLRSHLENEARLTIASYSRRVKIDFGVLDVEGGRLQGFREKPELNFKVSMGIYAMSRSLLEGRATTPLGFDEVLLGMLRNNDAPHIHTFDGYWLDIGRPEDYDQANRDFQSLREVFLGPVATDDRDAVIDLTGGHEVSHIEPTTVLLPVGANGRRPSGHNWHSTGTRTG